MSDPKEHISHERDSLRDSEHGQDQSEDEEADFAEGHQEESQEPRRSQRVRTLTEKGKEMYEGKIKELQQRFNYIYGKWRIHVKAAKQTLSQSTEPLSDDLLQDIIGDVEGLSADVQRSYDELRKVSPPDQDTRRKVDLCVGISKFIVSRATSRLGGKVPEQEQDWPEAGSLFNSGSSKSGSVLSIFKGASEHSSHSSVKRQEAAAEAAASQAVLKVLQEQEKEELELQRLEAEAKRKVADEEAAAIKRRLEWEEEEAKIRAKREEEHAALQKTLDEKRRKILQLEAMKSLNAAQARIYVYDQMKTEEGQRQDTVKQERVEVTLNSAPTRQPLKIPFIPQATATSSNDSTAELVKVLAGALTANRIPVPEPSVFSWDPLKYNDWKLSFETLIDQKNIQDKEKIYYLRRYVGGQAKNALEGYFLLGTESAYAAAWEILEERYGNPFTIAKS